ncbi:MAG: bifunctional folylpolyglutamate synthase/dihydrofolate synthase [Bacteroides sp.]|nr:bifunctional folylpolyglutamate synthase/dihydrofolate synthase [Bacteroides sp.]
MTYQNALDYLYSQLPMFSRVGAAAYKPGLDTSLAIDSFFGHPHRKFKSIHVGGTNGKGSTSHMLAAILQSQGYKVGLYTSPHLVDFRERMRVNGEMIPQEMVIEFVEQWQKSDYNGHPSFFELTMMMAFDWFAKENVDYAVIEVGMGGRLDSTNIITPEICVITNISNDHSQFLGTTLPAIATEKAGIIKSGIPVVIGEAEGEVRDVFANRAEETGAPIIFAEDDSRIKSICRHEPAGWEGESKEGKWISPLSGDYQQKNLNTVLHAVDLMREVGISIDDVNVIRGIEEVENLTGLRGRWTIIRQSPLTIADTGHNIAGITYNMNQLSRLMEERPEGTLRIVIGFVADKAIDKILALLPKDAVYYITNAAIPRALPASELASLMAEAGLKGNVYPRVADAYKSATNDADKASDIVFVGGSTFVVADLLSFLEKPGI